MRGWWGSTCWAMVWLTAIAAARLAWDGTLQEPFVPYADQTFQAVLVERILDPALWTSDAMVCSIDGFWPDFGFWVVAVLSGPFDALRTAWSAGTLLVAAVFLAGLFRLGRDLFDDPAVGWLAALATACVPRDVFIAEWSVVPLIPRFVTLAAGPWLIHSVVFRRRPEGAFLACGALACVHSLSAAQLFGLLLPVLKWGGVERRSWKDVAACVVAFVAGQLPAYLFLRPDLSGLESVSLDELRETCFGYFAGPYPHKLWRILTHFAVLGGVAAVGWGALRRSPRVARRALLIFGLASLAGAGLHLVVQMRTEWMIVAPLRATKWTMCVAVLAASAAAVGWMRRASVASRVLGGVSALLLVLPTADLAYDQLTSKVPAASSMVRASLASLPAIFTVDVQTVGREDEVRLLAAELAAAVEPHEVVLVPPRGLSTLRLWSRRSVWVLGEDSVVALYDADARRTFFERLEPTLEAYARGEAAVRAYAAEVGCRWALIPTEEPDRPLGLRLIGPFGND